MLQFLLIFAHNLIEFNLHTDKYFLKHTVADLVNELLKMSFSMFLNITKIAVKVYAGGLKLATYSLWQSPMSTKYVSVKQILAKLSHDIWKNRPMSSVRITPSWAPLLAELQAKMSKGCRFLLF